MRTRPNVPRDLAVKFVLIGIISWFGLTVLGPLSLAESLAIALFVTLAAYTVGDLLVLQHRGNLEGVFADLFLSIVVVLAGAALVGVTLLHWQIWFTALLIALGEFVYHRYLILVGYRHGAVPDETP